MLVPVSMSCMFVKFTTYGSLSVAPRASFPTVIGSFFLKPQNDLVGDFGAPASTCEWNTTSSSIDQYYGELERVSAWTAFKMCDGRYRHCECFCFLTSF